MTWLRLDDCIGDHPKVIGLSSDAFKLHILGMCYASRFLTDGFVPIIYVGRARRSLAELCEAGLWTPHEGGIGYFIHDYLDYQQSRADVEARRKQRSEAGRKGADVRWQQ